MGVFAKRSMTKTRRRLRDADQAKADLLSPRHLEIYKETKSPEDLPGLGLHYCTECSRWFETDVSLVLHAKGKPHKRRLKLLREGVFDHKAAADAIGYRTDNGPEKTKTQDIEMA